MNNCLEFRGNNLDCKKYTFKDFHDPSNFDSKKFKRFISSVYGNKNSPFSFSEDYLNYIPDPNKFRLNPQQKFAGSYINYNTNFNGCLIMHELGNSIA